MKENTDKSEADQSETDFKSNLTIIPNVSNLHANIRKSLSINKAFDKGVANGKPIVLKGIFYSPFFGMLYKRHGA